MRITAIALIVSLITLTASNALAQETTDWRHVAEAIQLGSKVKIQTTEGQRLSGTLMRVDDTSVSVKKNTRRPEAAVTITYDRIANLERDHGSGMSWGKAVGIGLGAGAGVMLTLIFFAMQLDD